MNRINLNLVLECLEELSDRQLQENLWLGKVPRMQSSFVEAVESLFTDSGLSDQLNGGTTGFSTEAETALLQLDRQLKRVDETRGPAAVISSSAMASVRDLAAVALERLRTVDS